MSGAGSEVPVRTLLITVFESVTEVFILCLAGYVLSRAGVTDKATQRKLNVINVSMFTPALLFSKVAYSLTPAKLKEMWIIPLGFVIVTALSAAVAWGLSRAFRLKRSQTQVEEASNNSYADHWSAFAICAAMFQNSNSLPIALIQSLVIEVPHLKWGADDTKDQMLGRALTYLVLYSTLGMMLRWSWGVKLLSQADDEVPDVETAAPHAPDPHATAATESPAPIEPHPGARETDPYFSTARAVSQDEEDERRNPRHATHPIPPSSQHRSSLPRDPALNPWTDEPEPMARHLLRPGAMQRNSTSEIRSRSRDHSERKKPTRTDSGRVFWGLPDFERKPRDLLPDIPAGDSSDSEDENDEIEDQHSTSFRRFNTASSRTSVKALAKKAGSKTKRILSTINAFMTVPMYAALLSVFIALVPPLQAALQKAKPLEQAIRSAGACSIPVTLVVLGAFFYAPPPAATGPIALPTDDEEPSSTTSHNSLGGYFGRKLRSLGFHRDAPAAAAYPGENKTVLVAVLSRMVIVPALLLPVIAVLAWYDLFEAAEDPVFILSAVLLVSSPPALTLAQITQAASGDAFERLISKTISWSYAVLTPPLTLVYVVIGLIFGRL